MIANDISELAEEGSPRGGAEEELGQIIALAETSASTVDSLSDYLSKSQLRLMVVLVFLMFVLVGAFITLTSIVFVRNPVNYVSEYSWISYAILAVFVCSAIAIIYLLNLRLIELRKTKQELRLEIDICGRLSSMIDDQLRRVRREASLSPIALATLEIRIRRLARIKIQQ